MPLPMCSLLHLLSRAVLSLLLGMGCAPGACSTARTALRELCQLSRHPPLPLSLYSRSSDTTLDVRSRFLFSRALLVEATQSGGTAGLRRGLTSIRPASRFLAALFTRRHSLPASATRGIRKQPRSYALSDRCTLRS